MSDHPNTVTYYDDYGEFLAVRDRDKKMRQKINGFFRMNGEVCEIHIMRRWPKIDACTLRHEQRHCIDGYWHAGPSNDCDTGDRGMVINGDWSY